MSKIKWDKIEELLQNTFGAAAVESSDKKISISFDQAIGRDAHLAYMLLESIQRSGLLYTTEFAHESQGASRILIPENTELRIIIFRENDVDDVWKAVEPFQRLTMYPDGNEVHLRPEELDSRMNDLKELTGRPWAAVMESPYGEPILEAILEKTPTKVQRAEQELALAEAVLDRPIPKVKNWLERQEEIELKRKMPPRTAIPLNLVDSPNTHNSEKGTFWDRVVDSRYTRSTREKLHSLFR